MATSVLLLVLAGAVAIQAGTFPVIPTLWIVFLCVLVLLLGLVS
jgi:hypothetical protein